MKLHIIESGAVECKRLYLQTVVTVPCPTCGDPCVRDFSKQYLAYPRIGEPEVVYFGCDPCDEEFGVEVTLNVSLSVSDETKSAYAQEVPNEQ